MAEQVNKLKSLLQIKVKMSAKTTRDIDALETELYTRFTESPISDISRMRAKLYPAEHYMMSTHNVPHYLCKLTGFAPQVVLDPSWERDVRLWGIKVHGVHLVVKYIDGDMKAAPQIKFLVAPGTTDAQAHMLVNFLKAEFDSWGIKFAKVY